jgi:hypothetical protein
MFRSWLARARLFGGIAHSLAREAAAELTAFAGRTLNEQFCLMKIQYMFANR